MTAAETADGELRNCRYVMRCLKTQIDVLITQAARMPKTGSLEQARLLGGLHEMRDIAAKALTGEKS